MYILRSEKDKKLYIGYTSDLERRFKEHNMGLSKSTKYRVPLSLIYYEAYHAENDARTREKRLKHFQNSYKELKKRLKYSLDEA